MIFDWQQDAYRYAGAQAFVPPVTVGQALIYVGLIVWSLWPRAFGWDLRDRSLGWALANRDLAYSLRDRGLAWRLLGRVINWELEEVRP